MRTQSTNIINFEQVKPTEPIAPYLGGKRLLAKTIVPIIEKSRTTYTQNRLWVWAVFSLDEPKSQNARLSTT